MIGEAKISFFYPTCETMNSITIVHFSDLSDFFKFHILNVYKVDPGDNRITLISRRLLTYADVFGRMLTYADVC